jgi:predicted ribosome quality control (RQC) complex YloA/Tae2 family protein
LEPGKGRKAAEEATHSAFDLGLSKNLKGARLLEIEAVERERTLIFWFSAPSDEGRLGLVVTLIPAQPEAYLVADPGMKVLAHSRQAEVESEARFVRPDGLRAPDSPEIREDLVRDTEVFRRAVEEALSVEAFALRLQRLDRVLAERFACILNAFRNPAFR